jgi:hypothetical protein
MMGTIISELEKAGIPTVSVVAERNETRLMAAALGGGIPDAPYTLVDEDQLYTADGGKKVAGATYKSVVDGLTKWQPQYMKLNGAKWAPVQEELSYSGANYEEALAKFNASYLSEYHWGDGLPLVPPTREKVDAILAASPLPATEVIGKWGPAGAEYTVEKIAVNAAMAGARPEYFPVILAAMQAITSQKYQNQTNVMKSPVPLVIVNGPIATQIKLNSGSNVLGPNPEYPANATIGRAIHFAMLNIGNSGHGLLPSYLMGSPGGYAGIVIAEAEDIEALTKKGWDPLNVQLGFPKGSNVVTVLGVNQIDEDINGAFAATPYYPAPDTTIWPAKKETFDQQVAGVVLVTELEMALQSGLVDDPQVQAKGYGSGKTKDDIAKMMYEQARVPRAEFNKLMLTGADGKAKEPAGFIKDLLGTLKEGDPVPIGASPKSFLVVATGGH